jgi:hypothetical protein
LAEPTGADLGFCNILVDVTDAGEVPVRVVQPLLGILPVPGEIAVALRFLLF